MPDEKTSAAPSGPCRVCPICRVPGRDENARAHCHEEGCIPFAEWPESRAEALELPSGETALRALLQKKQSALTDAHRLISSMRAVLPAIEHLAQQWAHFLKNQSPH